MQTINKVYEYNELSIEVQKRVQTEFMNNDDYKNYILGYLKFVLEDLGLPTNKIIFNLNYPKVAFYGKVNNFTWSDNRNLDHNFTDEENLLFYEIDEEYCIIISIEKGKHLYDMVINIDSSIYAYSEDVKNYHKIEKLFNKIKNMLTEDIKKFNKELNKDELTNNYFLYTDIEYEFLEDGTLINA